MFGPTSLKRYTVHHKEGVEDSTLFIREGFSVGAFLLGFLWLLYHRAWAPGLLLLVLVLLLRLLEVRGFVSPLSADMLQLGIGYWAGMEGRDWWREALERRGWRFADIVMAESEERAELRYFERNLMVGGGIAQSTAETA